MITVFEDLTRVCQWHDMHAPTVFNSYPANNRASVCGTRGLNKPWGAEFTGQWETTSSRTAVTGMQITDVSLIGFQSWKMSYAYQNLIGDRRPRLSTLSSKQCCDFTNLGATHF